MRRVLLIGLGFGIALPAAACGAGRSASTTSTNVPVTVVSTTTATTPPTTTASTTTASTTTAASTTMATTTTIPPETTTTEAPPESWIIAGREYYFPVQPPDAASYGRDHHDYPATDIFAEVGVPVVAVTAGIVDEASSVDEWDSSVDDPATRSGRYVSVIGDDGVRYYTSHLDTVAPGIGAGVRVHAGQQIGTVGNSGNAAPTPPHVHFGLSHPTFAGDWEVRRGEVWPWPYLDAWKAGEDSVPVLD